MLPNLPEGSSMDQQNEFMKTTEGKPWVMIQYHNKMENNMAMNMVRGLLVDIIAVFLFCWLISKMAAPSFGTILASALVVGLISFLFGPYTGSIWYQWFDIWAFLLDAIAAWGLTGLWLGWWLRRGKTGAASVRMKQKEMEIA